jgi:hypothetical protein
MPEDTIAPERLSRGQRRVALPPGAGLRTDLRPAAGRSVLNYLLLDALTALGPGLLPAKLLTEVLAVTASYQVQRRTLFLRRARAQRPAQHRPTAAALRR